MHLDSEYEPYLQRFFIGVIWPLHLLLCVNLGYINSIIIIIIIIIIMCERELVLAAGIF